MAAAASSDPAKTEVRTDFDATLPRSHGATRRSARRRHRRARGIAEPDRPAAGCHTPEGRRLTLYTQSVSRGERRTRWRPTTATTTDDHDGRPRHRSRRVRRAVRALRLRRRCLRLVPPVNAARQTFHGRDSVVSSLACGVGSADSDGGIAGLRRPRGLQRQSGSTCGSGCWRGSGTRTEPQRTTDDRHRSASIGEGMPVDSVDRASERQHSRKHGVFNVFRHRLDGDERATENRRFILIRRW